MPRLTAEPFSDTPLAERAFSFTATGGAAPPPQRQHAIANGVIAMALFLGTETMLFAGMISAFLILRAEAVEPWPPPGQPRLPAGVTALNTAVLLLSGYTMQRATNASRGPSATEVMRWLTVTVTLGAAFLAVQGMEWIALVRHGLRVSSGPFGASFYTLVGCHGVHVMAAVVTLIAVLASLRGEGSAERRRRRVEVCRLYWIFVVAVWPVLYVLVYLT